MDDETNNMQAVIDAARAGLEASQFLPGLAFIPQKDGRLESVAKHLPTPLRKRGNVTVFDPDSFNALVSANLSDDHTAVVYIDRDVNQPKIVAVMNDHGPTGAGWRDHRVSIGFRNTPEWVKWKAIDGKMMGQEQFAEFVEDNLADVAEPVGGALLEIVTYLEATRTVNFKSAIRLSDGSINFRNEEAVDAKVGAGQIAVPETFTLGISPFFGVPNYRVPARFRYRLKDGKLTLGFKLQRAEELIASVVNDICTKIALGAGVTVVEGIAPAEVGV